MTGAKLVIDARRIAAIVLAGLMATALAGCSHTPQYSPKNFRLLAALRTAVSAHKAEWLEASAKQIDQAHSRGEISQEGYDALEKPIAAGRTGDWQKAEKQIVDLEKGRDTERKVKLAHFPLPLPRERGRG